MPNSDMPFEYWRGELNIYEPDSNMGPEDAPVLLCWYSFDEELILKTQEDYELFTVDDGHGNELKVLKKEE